MPESLNLRQNGAKGPLTLSSRGAREILQKVSDDQQGVSFEFWVRPKEQSYREYSSIFTLGSYGLEDDEDARHECDRTGFDLQLAEVDEMFMVTFRTAATLYYPCFSYPVVDYNVKPGKIVHLVIVLESFRQGVYINGQAAAVAEESFDNSLAHWREGMIMGMFAGLQSQGSRPWQGSLYQFSIYSGALSPRDVEGCLISGLPKGQPFSISYDVVVNEDAESAPGSHPHVWYSSAPTLSAPNEKGLQRISLRTRFVRDDVRDLLHSVQLEPSFDNGHELSGSVITYITGLPSKGSIHHLLNGHYLRLHRPISESYLMPIEDPQNIIFLPYFNENSAIVGTEYANILYCVTDRVIFDPMQCESSTISIIVDQVNDPPVALASPLQVEVVEGMPLDQSTSIELGGQDVDGSVIAVRITAPPKWGSLFLLATSFRGDDTPHGTKISAASNFSLASQGNSIQVLYVFGGSKLGQSVHPVPGGVAMDSFRFQVSDDDWAWSLEETVLVTIRSAVTAFQPELPPQVLGDVVTNIELSGNDASGYHRPVAYFIESIPDDKYGSLHYYPAKKQLEAGSVITPRQDGRGSHSALVSFEPLPTFCETTERMPPTRFSFKAVTIENEVVTSVSLPVTLNLNLNCKRMPFTFQFSSSLLRLQGFDLRSINETACSDSSIYESSPLPASCREVAELEGIQFVGKRPPKSFDILLVTILTENALITFTENAWLRAKVMRGSQRLASGNVSFLAGVANLDRILSGMALRSQTPGDNILRVLIQHEGCIGAPAAADATSCNSDGIVIVRTVAAQEARHEARSVGSVGFPDGVLLPWAAYPLLYVLFFRGVLLYMDSV